MMLQWQHCDGPQTSPQNMFHMDSSQVLQSQGHLCCGDTSTPTAGSTALRIKAAPWTLPQGKESPMEQAWQL